jgi:hypothetical protein
MKAETVAWCLFEIISHHQVIISCVSTVFFIIIIIIIIIIFRFRVCVCVFGFLVLYLCSHDRSIFKTCAVQPAS